VSPFAVIVSRTASLEVSCLAKSNVVFWVLASLVMQTSVFSVDVEDWFHILDVPSASPISEWGSLPSRVEWNFSKLLSIFDEKNVHVTCFFLGWIAERYPHLVKDAAARGHEVASHGYAHRLVFEQTQKEFREDVHRARSLLEDIAGVRVTGYRAPGFSTTEQTPWFFDVLAEAGYEYDSSVFPAPRGHGGLKSGRRAPHYAGTYDKLLEIPISVVDVWGKPICFFGGGYLRLFPYWMIRRMSKRVLQEGRPVIFYVHPREVDPEHPRLAMKLSRHFKSYVNLESTEYKVKRILDDFPVSTLRDVIAEHRQFAGLCVARS
jgi:polysaccharide deacetylase family protein (PEP-CTERM system associated)